MTQTCADYKKTWRKIWHKVLCSDVTDANIDLGDSGAPVFLWNGTSDRITLVGVFFDRWKYYDHTFFSSMNQIRQDLGNLEVRASEFRSSNSSGGGGGGDCGGTDPYTIIEPC